MDEVTHRLIMSIATSALWLAITLVLLWLLRVKNPSVRYLFLLVPLVKSLLALVREQPRVEPFDGVFIFITQFTNLAGFIPDLPDNIRGPFEPSSALVQLNVWLLLILVVAFFGWRLAGFFQFMRIMSRAPELDRDEYGSVYVLVERLVAAAGIRGPRLVYLNLREAPFTVGLRRPIIAVSKVVMDMLAPEELEAVLAHEIAHIARRDYLYHWGIVLLRDLLFFNPLTYFIYTRLSFERERACDDYGSNLTQRFRLAKSLVKLAEAKTLAPSTTGTRSFAPQALIRRNDSNLARRVKELLGPSSHGLPSSAAWFGLSILALLLINFEIHVVVMVSSGPLIIP